jgi:hypothetical protein
LNCSPCDPEVHGSFVRFAVQHWTDTWTACRCIKMNFFRPRWERDDFSVIFLKVLAHCPSIIIAPSAIGSRSASFWSRKIPSDQK